MTRAEGAFALHRVCFNLFGCKQLGLDVLADVVRGAECYRLVSGEIHRTCDLVEKLVRKNAAYATDPAPATQPDAELGLERAAV